MARGIISGKVRLRKPASCIVSNSDTEICDGSSRLLPPSFILELAGFLIVDSRHGSIDRVNYVFMVTSVTPSIEQYMPPAQARAEYRSAYVTLDPVAYLSSTTLVTQLAKQTHASPNVAITNGTDSYHRNQQFSITAVTASAGVVTERYAYTAYGLPTILDAAASVITASAISNRYTYTGREWDATLALHHFRERWMSPNAGRFLSRDPIGFEGSEWGLYEFLSGNALVGTDPSGMEGIGRTRIPCPLEVDVKCAASCGSKTARPTCYRIDIPYGCFSIYFCNCQSQGCKPCIPPVGSRCWDRIDMSGKPHFNKNPPVGYIPTPHIHVRVMNQTPYPACKCIWNKVGDVIPGDNPGMMPSCKTTPAAGGGPVS